MVGPVGQGDPQVDQRVPRQDTRGHGLLDALVHRRDVLGGDGAALDLVDELVASTGAERLEVEDDVGELALAAGLLDVAEDHLLDGLADGLAVGDLGLADVGVDPELAGEPVDEDLEMQLAHAGDDRLPGLGVGIDLEGRVFLGEALQRRGQLLLVDLGLRLDRQVDDGLGEDGGLEDDGLGGVAERVAGEGVLHAHDRHDVTREGRLLVLPVVGVHLEDAADALLAVVRGVRYRRARLDHAGVDPEVGEPADVGVGHDLEGQGGERCRVVRGPVDELVLVAGHVAHRGRDV